MINAGLINCISYPLQPPVPKPRTIRPVGHQVPNSAQLPPYPSAGSATALPQPPVVAPKPSAARTTVQDRYMYIVQ